MDLMAVEEGEVTAMEEEDVKGEEEVMVMEEAAAEVVKVP